jgi:hypothetical protein
VSGRSRLRVALGVALAAALGLGACGIGDDSQPRDIADADRPNPVESTVTPQPGTAASGRIFLLAPDRPGHLRPSTRNVGDSAGERLRSLFGPLSTAETSARLGTAIPAGLQLLSANRRADGTLVVDVSEQLLDVVSTALIEAVAQIVFTASEAPGVERVLLLVNGRSRQFPAGDGSVVSTALTVFDYPGFIETSQPDFPAVPSPEA